MKKTNKLAKYIPYLEKLRNLKWIDVLGIATFFFILFSGAFFFLRAPGEVIVTMRLYEKNTPDFYFNRSKNIFVEKLKPGLRETDEIGRSAIEVIDVYRYLTNNVYHDVFVTLKIKTTYNRKTGQHSFNGKPILIGSFYTFRLKDIILNGTIVDIGNENIAREKKTFIIEAYLDPVDHDDVAYEVGGGLESVAIIVDIDGIKNYLAKEIDPGIKMLDSKNDVIVEILSVDKSPARIAYVQRGQYKTTIDPKRTRVELTMKLIAEKIGGEYYYQIDTPLIIGEKIELATGNLRLFPTIISIQEAQ